MSPIQTPGGDSQRILARTTSSTALVLGYCLFIAGAVAPAWLLETGYVYGLWTRCADGVCVYNFTGFSGYLFLVRCAVVTSCILLTISIVCLMAETIVVAAGGSRKNTTCVTSVTSVAAVVGEILAAGSLALYGCKTVMAQEKLPALSWSFALAGVGVIVMLIGSILRALGPPASWGYCLEPTHRNSSRLSQLGADTIYPDTLIGMPIINPKTGLPNTKTSQKKVCLTSCCHMSKRGYTYSSFASSRSSSVENGYRHYEELNFDDMPPPPLELLHFIPATNQSVPCYQETLPAYPDVYPHTSNPHSHNLNQPYYSQHVVSTSYSGSRSLPHSVQTQSPLSSIDTSRRVRGTEISGTSSYPTITPRHTSGQRQTYNPPTSKQHRIYSPSHQQHATFQPSTWSPSDTQNVVTGTRHQTIPIKKTRKKPDHLNRPNVRKSH